MKKSLETAAIILASASLAGGAAPASAEAVHKEQKTPVTISQLAKKAIQLAVNADSGKGGPSTIYYNQELTNGNTASVAVKSTTADNNYLPSVKRLAELDIAVYKPQPTGEDPVGRPVDSYTFLKIGDHWKVNRLHAKPAQYAAHVTEVTKHSVVDYDEIATPESISVQHPHKVTGTAHAQATFQQFEVKANHLLNQVARAEHDQPLG